MLELNKIYNDDCLHGMKQIDDASIDCVICDLPYGITRNKWDSIIPLEPLWTQYKRIIKRNGAILLFSAEPFASHLRLSNLEMYKYDLIWKPHSTNFGKQRNYKSTICPDSPAYPRSVIEITGVVGNSREKLPHPTQKPVALMEYLIKTYTNENDLVLDNCTGSASTAIAAWNTGRNFIGFEIDREYYELSVKRIHEHQGIFYNR